MAAAPTLSLFPDPLPEVARQELLGLPVVHLADLPAPSSLCAVLDEEPGVLILSTSRAAVAALQEQDTGAAILTPNEYEVLALAMGDGVLGRAGAMRLLRLKAKHRRVRITPKAALGEVEHPSVVGKGWTFADLFGALGARLVAAQVEAP